jgi:hypothetical protein
MSRVAPIVIMGLSAGCLPRTDLPTGGLDPGNPAVIQAAQLVEPTPGAVAPRNLAAVVLRLPSPLRDQGVVQLRAAQGPPVTLGAGVALDCTGGGRCYAFPLAAPVDPGRYRVAGPAGAFFDDGRPVPSATTSAFDVEPDLDATPPVVEPPLVETVGDCVRVRFNSDEPVRASLVVRAAGVERTLAAGEGTTTVDLATRLDGLTPGIMGELVVRAVDWAGNVGESPPLPLAIPPVEPPLVITEVLANPVGPEASQEFVELRNLGTTPVDLEGMLIEDATGRDPLPPATLAPGAFAVIVPAAYNVLDGRDPPVRTTAMLLRVEGRIGRDGIGNAGEAVRLRAKTGEVLSRYGGWVDVSASAWTGHSVQRQPQDACDAPSAWTTHPQAPTPGW